MKIAVLIGSPRKKDSYSICKKIEKEMNGINRDIEFDYIFLKEYDIKDCIGCSVCFKESEKLCPLVEDDLEYVKERLFSADGIIISTPVYGYQVSGQLKRFIDRMCYLFHRQKMVGIPTLIVITTDGGGAKAVFKYLKMVVQGWGMNLAGNLSVTSPMYLEDSKYFNDKNKEITGISKKLIEEINSLEDKIPTLYDIFLFNCLRSKTYTSKSDFNYWKEKGWIEKDYFYDVKLNILKKAFGNGMKIIIDIMGKKYIERI